METIYKVRKSLEKNKDDIDLIELVVVSRGALDSKYTFTSIYEFDNFISRDDNDSLYKGQFEVIIDRECDPFTLKSRVNYRIKVYPVKKIDRNVPYYQFYNGNVCNINGDAFAPEIKNVIFNPPATIVLWADNTKTVVKCHGEDKFDPEKGLAMAISKKMLSNKYEYYNVFKKWLKKWEKEKEDFEHVKKAIFEPIVSPAEVAYYKAVRLKELTNMDLDEIIDILENGGYFLPGPKYLETDLTINFENKIYCKDCTNFIPAGKATEEMMPDVGDSDGVCTRPPMHCVDAFETCADAAKKAGENLKKVSESVKCKKIAPGDVELIEQMIDSKIDE